MELQTHKSNCLLPISTLIFLKHLIHSFIQQTFVKHLIWVWHHLNVSKHISTNWVSFYFPNLVNPSKGAVQEPGSHSGLLLLIHHFSQVLTQSCLFYLLSSSKTYSLLSAFTATILESLSRHGLLQWPLNWPLKSILLLPNPFSSCIQHDLFFLKFLTLIYLIEYVTSSQS